MKTKPRTLPMIIASIVALVGIFLIIQRGGALAWLTTLMSVGMIAKAWFKPGRFDTLWVLGIPLAAAGIAVLTLQYVIGKWESGEVVELSIPTPQGTHIARLWVLDINDREMLYYDAPSDAAQALLSGVPVGFKRAQVASQRKPVARTVAAVNEAEAQSVLNAMQDKYGALNDAALYYYGLLGQPADNVELLIEMQPLP